MAVGCLVLGSTQAFNAFLNVGIMGADLAFVLPVAISLFTGRKTVRNAPWSCGSLGKVCNIISVVWVMISLVLFCMVSTALRPRLAATADGLRSADRHPRRRFFG
jgi:hypothetical protein